jgi:TonB family protein
MTPMFARAAAATVRLWTHIYTYGLPSTIRDARREEIASDLWHATRDPENSSVWRLGLQTLLRLLLGLPDDLQWRVEQQALGHRGIRVLVTASGVVILALAGMSAWATVSSPPLPPAPEMPTAREMPPPPPPPAPPQPRISRDATSPGPPQLVYGRATYAVETQGNAPARIKAVAPVYPPILLAAGVEGVVVVQGRITTSGRVADVRAVQPQGLLTQSAIDAVRQWEFEPLERKSGSVDTLTVSVYFTRRDVTSSQSHFK